ncbi:tetratricopeptide repeat (TPR)-like superfamily protein [Tasmannia lanceolata]|uniref:tetratricopeptide repeat (TPR)-like superfamily protein n=1 Tax=Tasmannia lanceolata TaxID=3420 RepID=UPI004062A807
MSRVRSREAERGILRLLHGRQTRIHLTQIHAHFLRRNLDQSNLLLSHFVSVCSSLRKMPYAHRIYLQTSNPNLLLFNSMIKGYSLSSPSKESFHLFSLMKNRGIFPDQFTFPPLLKSSSNLRDLDLGRAIHAEILIAGFEAYNSVRIGLVELYTSCEKMEDAQQVFDEMSQRDVIVSNLMIYGFCRGGDVGSGFCLFRQMSEQNVVTWNTMISGFAQIGHYSEAMELFREMLDMGFEPDDATIVIVLPVCARLGCLDFGRWVHSYADGKGFLNKVVAVGNSLVDMYCKCGDLASARRVFDEMPLRNVVSWNSMITGLAFNGYAELGLEMFEEMKRQGVEPNEVTFLGVLSCCTHAGLVSRGHEFFDLMIKVYQINPKLAHYGCMVDLFGRSGCVEEAHCLIRSMPMRPSAAIWGALLSACRTHGNLEVAEYAAKELIGLEPWNSGNYVLLSNVYAEAGRWEDVKKARVLMRENSVRKAPGRSSIESNENAVCL